MAIIEAINKEMTIDIKDLGHLDRFNGVDIVQAKHFVKIHNETYLKKLMEEHNWMLKDMNISNTPIPFHHDSEYSKQIENAKPPETLEEQRKTTKNGIQLLPSYW